jgi:hypothetical protein
MFIIAKIILSHLFIFVFKWLTSHKADLFGKNGDIQNVNSLLDMLECRH